MYMSAISSILTYFVMGYARSKAVFRPFSQLQSNPTAAWKQIATIWIIALSLPLIEPAAWIWLQHRSGVRFIVNQSLEITIFSLVSILFIVSVMIFSSYAKALYGIRHPPGEMYTNRQLVAIAAEEMRLTKTTAAQFCTFFVAFITALVVFGMAQDRANFEEGIQWKPVGVWLQITSQYLFTLSSALNPIIVLVVNKVFRW